MHFGYSYALQGSGADFPDAHSHTFGRAHERVPRSSIDDIPGHLAYPDHHRQDSDLEDDIQDSLLSQTLNADGTPKRPMNAFMIFARKRRPQVSAENHSLRTGEISKLLSREWNSMDPAEKQFYLDQAKQLKDTFNTKYPDYVYRRRPNNSRKRRRADTSHGRSMDSTGSVEAKSDVSAGTDPSSVGSENSFSDDLTEMAHSQAPAVSPSPLSDPGRFQQKPVPYSYPQNDLTYRHLGPSDGRFPYASSAQDRVGQDIVSGQHRSPSRVGSSSHYQPYPQSKPGPVHYAKERSLPALPWDSPSGGGVGRVSTPSWLGNQETSTVLPPPTLHSHTAASSSWPVGPSSSSSETAPTLQPSYSFSTLNSPFQPDAVHVQSSFSDATSSSQSSRLNSHVFPHASPPSFSNSHTSGRQLAPSYDHAGYHLPPTSSSRTYQRDAALYDLDSDQQHTRLTRPLHSHHSVPPYAPSVTPSRLGAQGHTA